MGRGWHGRAGRGVALTILGALSITACSAVSHAASPSAGTGTAASSAAHPNSPSCLPPAPPPAATSAALPDLTLGCLGGAGTVRLTAVGGRAVLINLWASWCAPCRAEMPRIAAGLAATRAAGAPVPAVLGVDTKDTPANATAFLASEHVSWPSVSDPNAHLAAALHLPGLPVTIGLNPAGHIVYRHIGELTAADVSDAIRTVTAGVPAQPTAPAGKATS